MCSTKGLLSLSSIVFMLPWFNDASIASDAANLLSLANTSLFRRDTAYRALAMLAAYSIAVVRVVSILIGLRPSLALRGDGGGESYMRTMTGSRSAGTSGIIGVGTKPGAGRPNPPGGGGGPRPVNMGMGGPSSG